MADNTTLPATGTGTADIKVATDKVTYSGDADQNVQLMRMVQITGAEGSKTVVDLPGDATNGLDVDVTRMAALVAGTANIGDVDVLTMPDVTVIGKAADGAAVSGNPVLIAGQDGTNAQSIKTDASGELQVDVLTLPAVTNGGTFAVQVDGAALTALQLIDDAIKTDDAAFTVATDGVMMAGNLAVAMGANPDTADANDAVVGIANRHRVPFVIGGHPNVVSYGMSITTAVSNTVVGPTIASGTAFVCISLSALVDNDSTVFPSIVIGYGTANTPAFATTPGTAKIIGGHPKAPAGGGFTIGDGSGIIGVGASDEEVRITTVGTVGGNGLYILLKGYTIEI